MPYKDLRRRFGKLLSEAIKQADISQGELAKQIGVTGATVSRWENGISMPNDETLLPKISLILGKPSDYFAMILSHQSEHTTNHERVATKGVVEQLLSQEVEKLREENERLHQEIPQFELVKERMEHLARRCEQQDSQIKNLQGHINRYEIHMDLLTNVIKSLESRLAKYEDEHP